MNANSLNPRNKRFRAADRSLQQARNALSGSILILQDIPHSNSSSLAAALKSIADALEFVDEAAANLDKSRLELADDS